MKQITFRQLQTKLPDLKDLPVEITRYGRVIMVLSLPEDVTATLTATFKKNPRMVAVLQQHSENVTATPSSSGRCEAPNCKYVGVLYDGLYKEWFNGDLKTKPMLMCRAHLQKYQDMAE